MVSKLVPTQNCVAVWCDKPFYYPGDTIQGYVLLNVHDTFAAGSVVVKVKGYEKTSWTYHSETHETETDGDGNSRVVTLHHAIPASAKKEFFKVEVPLASFDSSQPLPLGQHQFPFQVVLPTNLPGSFKYKESRDSNYEDVVGKVAYKITAEVAQGGDGKDKHSVLEDSAEVIVRQRLTRLPEELVAETTTNVKMCCCFGSKGTVSVWLRVDKDAYTAGETANLLLEVDNRTSLAYPKVVLKLKRVVHLSATLGAYDRTETVLEQPLAGLEKGVSYLKESAQRLEVALKPSLAPTTQSSLVNCTYKASLEMSAGALTNNTKLSVPVTVYATELPHAALPDDWKPQMVHPAVDIKLPGV